MLRSLPIFTHDYLVPSPPLVLSSPLDPLSLLESSSSSALPLLLTLPNSLAPPWASSSLVRHSVMNSLALPQTFRPMFPPQSVCSLASPWFCTSLSPPWSVSPRTPLGSLVPPDHPQSVVALPPPQNSGSPAAPSTPLSPLDCGFLVTITPSLITLVCRAPP